MEKYIIIAALVYFLIINIISFALMGIDKKRAMRKEWRIRESTLFLTALLFGGLGSTIGMWHFRHKTKHWYFVFGMPTLMILNFVIIGFLCYKFLVA